jgi:predicted dehydrogenase
MVNVGIAGIGFMGMIHYLTYQKTPGVRVQALAELDQKRLTGDWRGIKGNFGPAGEMMDLSGISTYSQLEEMLADPSLDLIDICLPPSLHADYTVKALESGKHVFCEKPMALTVPETRRMVEAAEKGGKLLMIGHVLPLFPEYNLAYEAAGSGKYGKLLGGSFKRVISDPQWLPNYYDPAKIGGPMLDLHIHDAHFIRLLFGMPKTVTTQGRLRGEVIEYCNTQFGFEDSALAVNATTGVIYQQGRSFTHGYEIHFEQATITFEFAVVEDQPVVLMPCTILPSEGQVTRPELGSGDPVDAFKIEMMEVLKSLETGQPSEFLTADLAQDAIVLCHKQTESIKCRQTVQV